MISYSCSLPSIDFTIFRPADAARILGINEDSVTRYLKIRPSLFPMRAGRVHIWTREEFRRVVGVIRNLSPKARRAAKHQ